MGHLHHDLLGLATRLGIRQGREGFFGEIVVVSRAVVGVVDV